MTIYSAFHWAKKAEYWAGQASQGQIQADWNQSDNTKKDYIKNKPGINDLLPSQTGNSGKFLTTNGTSASWGVPKTHNLFDFIWRDAELNDQSWLRADTFSWQDGTVYTNAYNHLVDDIDGKTATSETVGSYTISYYLADDGHKITTDETTAANIYNESGVAWYYILDTTNQRFKLPRENPAREELIQVVRAKGNGKTLGLTDGTKYSGLLQTGDGGYPIAATTLLYDKSVGTPFGSAGPLTAGAGIGVTTDSTKSGIISDMTESTSVYKGKRYLYFYIGQYSQSATEQTAGLNSELFNGKVDLNLDNMNPSTTAKSYFAGIGMPSDTFIEIARADIDAQYTNNGWTAPKSGYIFILMSATSASGSMIIGVSTQKITDWYGSQVLIGTGFQFGSSGNGSFCGRFIPIRKGQVATIGNWSMDSWIRCVFVPAEGEE